MKSIRSKTLPIFSFLIAVLILFYKRPDAFYNSQFWAEEGSVFFADAYHLGLKGLFNTCLGYFHLYPRLVFNLALAAGVPLGSMPYVCCYSWLLMFLVLNIYIWNRIELDHTKKFFIVLSTVLLPMQSEVFMNLTNVQWIMALFPIIIFSSTETEKNKKWFWIDLILLFLTAFTGPNFLVLSPIILYILFKDRKTLLENKKQLVLVLIVPLATLVSCISLINFGGVTRTIGIFDPLNPGFIEYLFLQYAFLFFGPFAFSFPWWAQVVFTLFVFSFFLFILYKILKGQIHSKFRIIVFFSGLLFVMTTLYSYRFNPGILDPRMGAIRNFFIPATCFIWFLISGIQSKYRAGLISFVFSILLFYESVSCVGREVFVDYNWPYFSKQILISDSLVVPLNPPGWQLIINNSKKK